jgi:3-phosphoshikimate 1-carboxyvinyltransferase
MTASLTLRPGPALQGRLRAPGDKSITHRALLFGALADGRTEIENPNPGEDCAATLACLRALGVSSRATSGGLVVEGRAGRFEEPDRVLDCGNSGTTLRLLAGILAGQPFLSILTGDDSLRRRPVDRVVEPLRRMGARLHARGGDRLPPLVIHGGRLHAIEARLERDSAQVATAILLAGTFAAGETTVELGPARDHTERMLPGFGVPVRREEVPGSGRSRRTVRGPCTLRGASLRVPGDFSAAAFFLAAAAATPGARVTAEGVSLNPTRTGLLVALEEMGAQVERETLGEEAGEPVGDVTVTGPDRLRAVAIGPERLPTMVDEVPAWAVAAAAAQGTSVLRGAEELRLKESDRLAALATGLSRLGLAVTESSDGLAITGGLARGGTVDARGDHRIAMALAVLATRADEPVTILGAEGIPTSFPGFEAALAELGGRIERPARAVTS